jgi:hypothetical protein
MSQEHAASLPRPLPSETELPNSSISNDTVIGVDPTSLHQHHNHIRRRYDFRSKVDPTSASMPITQPFRSSSPPRQQHYKVRFAAVYTSANMPTTAAQRSRHSPPRATSTEPVESPVAPQDDYAEPMIEPTVQALTRSLKPSEESSQPDARGRQSSVERCPRCYEAWSKPLMPTSEWRQDLPARSTTDFARTTDTLLARLRQYGRDTEEKYEQWKEKHSHCLSTDHRDSNFNKYPAASTEMSHSLSSTNPSHPTAQSQFASNKRKIEGPHGNTSKLRKVLFSANPVTTPPLIVPAPNDSKAHLVTSNTAVDDQQAISYLIGVTEYTPSEYVCSAVPATELYSSESDNLVTMDGSSEDCDVDCVEDIEAQKQHVLNRLMVCVYEMFASADSSTRYGGSKSTGSPIPPKQNSASSVRVSKEAGTNRRQDKRKKDSDHDDDDDDDGDGENDKSKRCRRRDRYGTSDQKTKKKLACPYYKRSPHRSYSSGACYGPGWDTVSRIKYRLVYRCDGLEQTNYTSGSIFTGCTLCLLTADDVTTHLATSLS